MFRLLIVQSEYADYSQLCATVDFRQMGVDEVEWCGDGQTAFEKILKDAPDAVFTDIRLPGLDGIELLSRCREHGIACRFVIVSRWARFEYAQSVMRLGAEDYLVKPVERSELLRVIGSLVEDHRAQEAKDINQRLFSTRRALRNSFMAAFTAADAPEHYSIEELNQTYHFKFREGVFRSAIISIYDLPQSECGVFLPALAQNMRARFDPLCYEMIPYIRGNERLTLTFNYAEESAAGAHFGDLLDILEEHKQKRGCDKVSFSIGLGTPETDIRDLHRTLETAERAVRCRMFRGPNQLFAYDSMRFEAINGEDLLTPTVLGELRSSVDLLDYAAFRRTLDSAFAPVSYNTDPAAVIDISRAAADAVFCGCRDAGYAAVTKEDRNVLLDALSDSPSLSNLIDGLADWTQTKFAQCQEERRSSRPVRTAQRYIQTHYMEPLTLEHIAEQVHLNASYFSIVFKKQTGRNFSDFLTECRIEAAKQLLRETDMNVSDICEKVGYLDRKYFSRTFTKLVGVKPSVYRTLHG